MAAAMNLTASEVNQEPAGFAVSSLAARPDRIEPRQRLAVILLITESAHDQAVE